MDKGLRWPREGSWNSHQLHNQTAFIEKGRQKLEKSSLATAYQATVYSLISGLAAKPLPPSITQALWGNSSVIWSLKPSTGTQSKPIANSKSFLMSSIFRTKSQRKVKKKKEQTLPCVYTSLTIWLPRIQFFLSQQKGGRRHCLPSTAASIQSSLAQGPLYIQSWIPASEVKKEFKKCLDEKSWSLLLKGEFKHRFK